MIGHYLLTAWRTFLRFKVITTINIVGLALGLACLLGAIGTYSYFESADSHVPGSDRTVMILQRYRDTLNNITGPLMSFVSPAIPASMRKEFPTLTIAYVNGIGSIPVDVDGRREFAQAAVVDSEYFDILDWPRAQLNPGNPFKTQRTAVVSEELAEQLFGKAQALGRTLRLRGALDVTVAGILRSNSLPSHGLGPYGAFKAGGLLISRDTARALTVASTGKPPEDPPLAMQWTDVGFGSALYVSLPAGTLSAAQLEPQLQGLPARNGAPDFIRTEIRVSTLPQVWIQEMDVNLFKGSTQLSLVGLTVALGIAALCVSLANYINLSFAQASARTKETGLRRVIGAARSQLATQIAIEISLHLLFASLLGFCVALIVGYALEAYAALPLMRSVLLNGQFWEMTGATLIVILILLSASRFIGVSLVKPSDALRDAGSRQGSGSAAYALLAAQFVTMSVLTVVMLVVSAQDRQARRLAAETSTDVLVKLDSRYRLGGSKFDVWRAELLRNSAVKGVTSTTSPPWFSRLGFHPLKTAGDRIINPNAVSVGYDFEKVLDYRIVAGRSFASELRDAEVGAAAEPPVIVDETLAHALGFANPQNAIGESIRGGGVLATRPPVRIVGVIADKPLRLQPMLDFVGTLYEPDAGGRGDLIVRIDRNRVGEGLAAIDEVWRRLAPGQAVRREFSDEQFERVYAIYSLIGKILAGVALVALIIAVMGGFGFALFVTHSRAQEIGVRKTLGASAKQIFVMLLRDYSRPILIANVIGWPIGYIMVQRYLSTFEQPISFSLWYFAASLLFTLSIAWIAVSHQALRAAKMNPATVLRRE